jgi:hypothetical protein
MKSILIACMVISGIIVFSKCADKSNEKQVAAAPDESMKPDFNGYESQATWGAHIVTISGCNDCHTPKKMTDHGPVLDSSLLLSGHPAQIPVPDIDRKLIESKGLALAGPGLTEWVGPWGVSFTANLTPDPTGIGNWKEENFIYALREGKLKGLPGSRSILPPMPWEMFKHMTDPELKAVFAYLKSIKPVSNIVPQPLPPVSAAH